MSRTSFCGSMRSRRIVAQGCSWPRYIGSMERNVHAVDDRVDGRRISRVVLGRTLYFREGRRWDRGYSEERIWHVESCLDLYLSGLIIKSQDKQKRMRLNMTTWEMTCLRSLLAGMSWPSSERVPALSVSRIDIEAASSNCCEPCECSYRGWGACFSLSF